MATQQNYKEDVYAWFMDQAKFLRSKEFEKIDIENLAEEITEMGDSYACELESCLRVLFMHILKWKFQEERRGKSWINSIEEHRRRIKKRLKKTPSLKHKLLELALDAYEDALYDASEETKLPKKTFPKEMCFTIEEALQDDWLPQDTL
jgi:hypothetical protein